MDLRTLIAYLLHHPIGTLEQPLPPMYETPIEVWTW